MTTICVSSVTSMSGDIGVRLTEEVRFEDKPLSSVGHYDTVGHCQVSSGLSLRFTLFSFPLNMNREYFISRSRLTHGFSLFPFSISRSIDTNRIIKSNFHLSHTCHSSNISFHHFFIHLISITIMTHLVSVRPRTRLFTREQEELENKRRKEVIDDIIFYEDFGGRTQIISMKQMDEGTTNEDFEGGTKITRPRVRMFTRQQDQELNIKRRKVSTDDIIFYKDLDERTRIISMKQVEEGRIKIITTNKQKEEDIIFYKDLDVRLMSIDHPVDSRESEIDWEEIDREIESFLYEDPDEGKKIIEEQNSKMNNITKKDHNKTLEERSELIVHPVDSRERGVEWRELSRKNLGGTVWERELGMERVLQYYD